MKECGHFYEFEYYGYYCTLEKGHGGPHSCVGFNPDDEKEYRLTWECIEPETLTVPETSTRSELEE